MNETNSSTGRNASRVGRRAGDATDKLEQIESLRTAALKEIERGMVLLQQELAVRPCGIDDGDARIIACARRLRKAWNLLDCQRLEVGALEAKLEDLGLVVTQ